MRKNKVNFEIQKCKISEDEVREYVLQRFQEIKKSNKIKSLVTFQAKNKYMIMAHDQVKLKSLGNIVASHRKMSLANIWEKYEEHLKCAMLKTPTIKTHTNVMMHIFGYFSKNLSLNEKQLFFNLLEQFRENKITLGNILFEINPMIFHFNYTYLTSQTYFLLYSDIQLTILFQASNEKT